jgi:hypothetical protein
MVAVLDSLDDGAPIGQLPISSKRQILNMQSGFIGPQEGDEVRGKPR